MTENPETLEQWWDYVKTDDVDGKISYFLRNYARIAPRGTVIEFLEFLGTKVKLTEHRRYGPSHGCYSLEGINRNWVMRVDPTTPTVNGPARYPSLVVCW